MTDRSVYSVARSLASTGARNVARSVSRTVVVSTLCVLVMVSGMSANTNPLLPAARKTLRYGLFANVQANIHTAAFQELPGFPSCCDEYKSGFGLRGDVGLHIAVPLTSSSWFGLRADFSSCGATLSREENVPINVFPADSVHEGIIEHTIAASMAVVGFEPIIIYQPAALSLWAGPRISYALNNSFHQREEILQPDEAVFNDTRQKVRNEQAGPIPTFLPLQIGLTVGIGYYIPLRKDKTLLLQPQLSFVYNFTSLLENQNWHAHALRLGAALTFWPASAENPIEVDTTTSPAPLAPSQLAASLSIVRADAPEQPFQNMRIVVDETIATRMHPLLQYVFFDRNSAIIPSRYVARGKKGSGSFTPERLPDTNAIDVYRNILDIVGYRMQKNASITITLTGTLSSEEPKQTALAAERAEAVRQYLLNTWDIAPSRIAVEARGEPEVRSSLREAEGIEENQRVEIVANDVSLFDPVVLQDTIRTVTPPSVVLIPRANHDTVNKWNIDITQGNDVFKNFSGSGSIPPRILWDVREDATRLLDTTKRLLVRLDVNCDGERSTVVTDIKTDVISLRRKRIERRGMYAYDRYDLILFEFDKSSFSPAHTRALEIVRERIANTAVVTISGYTDRIGDEEHNYQLSCDRANAVYAALGKRGEVRCMGEAPEHNVSTPEGRFYSRMVRVEVSTPAE
ncbi:MAG: OmpA family protein [bacterium]|nr:OmpA family protein [bacterium]